MQEYRRCDLLMSDAFHVLTAALVANFGTLSSYNHIFDFNNF